MTNNAIIINDIRPRIQFEATGETATFSFSFVIFEKKDLEVYLNDDKQTSGYTVNLNADKKGSITFDVAPQSGTLVTLVRNMNYAQHTDFTACVNLQREVLHTELSRIFAMIQQIAYKIARAVAISDTSNIDPSVLVDDIEALYAIKDIMAELSKSADDIVLCASKMSAIENAPDQAAAAAASASAALASASAALASASAASSSAAAAKSSEDAAAATRTAVDASAAAAAQSVVDAQAIVDSFAATGETIISPTVRYFRIVTAAEYAEAPSEQKTSPAYLWFITA